MLRSAIRFALSMVSVAVLSPVVRAQVMPRAGQFLCSGTVVNEYGKERLISSPVKITRVWSVNVAGAIAAFTISGREDVAYYFPYLAGPPPQDSCSSLSATPPKRPSPPEGASALQSSPSAFVNAMKTKVSPSDPFDKIAQTVWETVLIQCKRPEENSPSYFYSQKSVEHRGSLYDDDFRIDWDIFEYQGPFAFVPPAQQGVSEAEKRNQGLFGAAQAVFQSNVYRRTALSLDLAKDGRTIVRGYSYKDPWSKWVDTRSGVGLATGWGNIVLGINKQKDGLTFSEGLYHWEPLSCATLISRDPFAEFVVRVRE